MEIPDTNMRFFGEIISNSILWNNYFRVVFYAPGIAAKALPGHFVHIKIANLTNRILRRPFSICDADRKAGSLTVIYKVVGSGTEVLSQLPPGAVCDLMGPLGKPFSTPETDETPVIVAGGYGAAATYMISKNSPKPGVLILGARSSNDLILVDDFKNNGFDTRTATEDGSSGHKGLVTELLDDTRKDYSAEKLKFYACGPRGMLVALGKKLLAEGLDGELSMDHLMCCGVGACFACVIKVKAENTDGWRYARTCTEGPVFNASEIYYENED
jgi:dihydroorotate dehydrogenase electron transfer subunit